MKHQDVLEAERQRLEGEVCDSLKVLASGNPRELGDFYAEGFTARGDQLRKLPYRVPEENDLAGAASILAQIGCMAFDLRMATEKVGNGSLAGKLDGVTRESAIALGRVLLGKAGEEEAAQKGEEETAPILRAQLDEKAARMLELWARADERLPGSHFADFDNMVGDLFEIGYELRGAEAADRGEYHQALYEVFEHQTMKWDSGPGIPVYKPRPESATKQTVPVPELRHRASVNAAAGILVEAYDQVHSLINEFLLDGPGGEIDHGIGEVLAALEGLMLKVGRLLPQDGDALRVGERMQDRWIAPEQSANGALVVVNGSKG